MLATVYRGEGRALVALASWAAQRCEISLSIDWQALGLDPASASLHAPAVAGLQPKTTWSPGATIPVEPGRGWFLMLTEHPEPGAGIAYGGFMDPNAYTFIRPSSKRVE